MPGGSTPSPRGTRLEHNHWLLRAGCLCLWLRMILAKECVVYIHYAAWRVPLGRRAAGATQARPRRTAESLDRRKRVRGWARLTHLGFKDYAKIYKAQQSERQGLPHRVRAAPGGGRQTDDTADPHTLSHPLSHRTTGTALEGRGHMYGPDPLMCLLESTHVRWISSWKNSRSTRPLKARKIYPHKEGCLVGLDGKGALVNTTRTTYCCK